MMRKSLKLILLYAFLSFAAKADKYWIYLDKDATPIEIKHELIKKFFYSKWLHAISAHVPCEQLDSIGDLPQVKDIVRVYDKIHLTRYKGYLSKYYGNLGFALEQINGQCLIDEGLNGKNVKIGIIDGGFLDADEDPALSHFFRQKKVLGYKDYITPDLEPYDGSARLHDEHGKQVWELIGGYHPEKYIQYGFAMGAEYYLARTDHGISERRIEEDYLIAALEWMASEDVKIVNISLGYTDGYDNKAENYLPKHMDGSYTAVTRAVNIAAENHGMLVIVAAGNDGQKSNWRVVSAPGDAKHALTVGATKLKVADKMPYSSIGYHKLNYVKPDISCFATTGTSFSAPVITGLAACIKQYDPTLTNFEIKDIIIKSAHLYPFGNNYLGYGIPDCKKVLRQLKGGDVKSKVQQVKTSRKKFKLKGRLEGEIVVVYHKKDAINVLNRYFLRPSKNKLKIKHEPGAYRSTITVGRKVKEVFWLNP